MNRDCRTDSGMPTDDSPPSEAWLFAQAILGKPIPRIVSARARAKAKREELKRLAEYSSRHAADLRQLEAAEAQARQDRETLEWAAQICDFAAGKLRAIERKEAEEREAWRRAEQYVATLLEGTSEARQPQAGLEQRDESSLSKIVEWDPNQPRQPKGTPVGGQWASKGGGRAVSASFSASVRDFDNGHDLTLQGALKNGKLAAGAIRRIKFTDDEVKRILKSAEKPGSDLSQTFYTAQNLPPRLRAEAEKDFPDLPDDEKYAMQAFVSNQRRARTILMFRNAAFQQYVGELYGLLRSLNAAHFMVEKGIVVATGKEPVLGGEASRLDALKDMLIYLAVMKGVGWGTSKISSLIVGPETVGDITIAFKGGGKLTIRRGAEYGSETLGDAVERAAAGKQVTIDPPAPKPPRPSLTDVPSITDDPRAFRRWFNELTPEELTAVWRNPKLRDAIEKGLRWPGGQHEWLMIARTPKFKEWRLTAEQIAAMRTPISKIRFKNPTGGHKGKGSITTHNQILTIIDSSPDFATFKARLQKWANDRLEGGAGALPAGLRP
jgi:hypothetical protein